MHDEYAREKQKATFVSSVYSRQRAATHQSNHATLKKKEGKTFLSRDYTQIQRGTVGKNIHVEPENSYSLAHKNVMVTQSRVTVIYAVFGSLWLVKLRAVVTVCLWLQLVVRRSFSEVCQLDFQLGRLMDFTEDLTPRILLKQILITEPPRTPVGSRYCLLFQGEIVFVCFLKQSLKV